MNRNIILERPVEVKCWRVVGHVAKTEKRPELMPVLLRASETGGTDARNVAEHLLFEPRSRRVVAERLLDIGVAYKLLEKRGPAYVLTKAGGAAIDTERVFVPEDGAWTIWASQDPLLPSPVLRIERWSEPNAYTEILGEERESARERSHEDLPAWLRKVVEMPITPSAGAAAIRIDCLEDKAEAVDANGSLRLIWNVDDGRLQLTGSLEGEQVATELEAPSMSSNRVWRALLENGDLLEQWDEEREVLCVRFDHTNDPEREAMCRVLKFDSPYLRDYGKFEPLTVPEVPIAAPSEADAQSWAEWRLKARIREYATTERYANWRKEAAAPFGRHELELPTRTQLALDAWKPATTRPDPRAWHLAAAEDWNL